MITKKLAQVTRQLMVKKAGREQVEGKSEGSLVLIIKCKVLYIALRCQIGIQVYESGTRARTREIWSHTDSI